MYTTTSATRAYLFKQITNQRISCNETEGQIGTKKQNIMHARPISLCKFLSLSHPLTPSLVHFALWIPVCGWPFACTCEWMQSNVYPFIIATCTLNDGGVRYTEYFYSGECTAVYWPNSPLASAAILSNLRHVSPTIFQSTIFQREWINTHGHLPLSLQSVFLVVLIRHSIVLWPFSLLSVSVAVSVPISPPFAGWMTGWLAGSFPLLCCGFLFVCFEIEQTPTQNSLRSFRLFLITFHVSIVLSLYFPFLNFSTTYFPFF